MSDLVGDHVGLREVAGGLVFGLQLVKKAKVEIDFFVRGAVKRPRLRARHAARARDRVSKSTGLESLYCAPPALNTLLHASSVCAGTAETKTTFSFSCGLSNAAL